MKRKTKLWELTCVVSEAQCVPHLLYCICLTSIPILAVPYHIWHYKFKCFSGYTEILYVNYKLKTTAHSFNLMELHITTHHS